jgi:predicted CxxxxCH...CXXCH cytochrome family protein
VCFQCHYYGSPNNPAGHPAAAPPAGAQPGCFNATLCHDVHTQAPHPIPFIATAVDASGNGHASATAAIFSGDCSNCHAYSGTAPVSGAPLCSVCHQLADPVAAGSDKGTCLSCHVGANYTTQGPAGDAWPSRPGAHAKHVALLTFTRTSPALPASLANATHPVCEACHSGTLPGEGNQKHYANANKRLTAAVSGGPAPVAVDPTFRGVGDVSYTVSDTAFTCSNVSCHGSTSTPSWQTGTLDSSTACGFCHQTNGAAANSPTGMHSYGMGGAGCLSCHSMTQSPSVTVNHWKYLDTPAISTSPDEVSGSTIFFPGGGSYSASSTPGIGTCAVSCHGYSSRGWTS